jgi:TM2 domain-containing membrane protein YozV
MGKLVGYHKFHLPQNNKFISYNMLIFIYSFIILLISSAKSATHKLIKNYSHLIIGIEAYFRIIRPFRCIET